MYIFLFIFAEIIKLMIIGPLNMIIIPVSLVKLIIKDFRRKKMTEEENINDKKLKLIKQVNKKGFFTNHTPVIIAGRERLGVGKIIKMDYDPVYYEPYDVDSKNIVLHIKFDGDSTVWFVNIENALQA